MIVELDDIIESLADQFGRYGCHINEEDENCQCRVCFTTGLRAQILASVEVEVIIQKHKEAE